MRSWGGFCYDGRRIQAVPEASMPALCGRVAVALAGAVVAFALDSSPTSAQVPSIGAAGVCEPGGNWPGGPCRPRLVRDPGPVAARDARQVVVRPVPP